MCSTSIQNDYVVEIEAEGQSNEIDREEVLDNQSKKRNEPGNDSKIIINASKGVTVFVLTYHWDIIWIWIWELNISIIQSLFRDTALIFPYWICSVGSPETHGKQKSVSYNG